MHLDFTPQQDGHVVRRLALFKDRDIRIDELFGTVDGEPQVFVVGQAGERGDVTQGLSERSDAVTGRGNRLLDQALAHWLAPCAQW